MIKILLTLLFCFTSYPSWAAIALISNTCASSSDGLTVTTSAINTTGADLIVVTMSLANSTFAAPTSSPSAGTFTGLTAQISAAVDGSVIYYISNPTTSSSQTFTENLGSNNYPSICVAAFSGTNTSLVFDVENGAKTLSNVTTFQPGTVTPSQNNELIITGIGVGGTTNSLTIDNGFTINGQKTGTGGAAEGIGMSYLIQTSASAVNPTWTNANNVHTAATIATFKVGSAATSGNLSNGGTVRYGGTVRF